ncbi:hypothetical protein AB7849_09320 [Rhodanobacter sp. 115]|uniref:hypothetical protein n=1 Tax=Rhodanobacter sp. FW021-MT20 TaxID=1162282 RepID=UPI0034E5245B
MKTKYTPPPPWLVDAIITGLKTLIALSSLERTPAVDMIQHTAMVWAKAVNRGRQLEEERDAPRIDEAFAVIAATYRTWPLPIDLIEALPPLERPAKALRLTSEESIRSGQVAIRDILEGIQKKHEEAQAATAKARLANADREAATRAEQQESIRAELDERRRRREAREAQVSDPKASSGEGGA